MAYNPNQPREPAGSSIGGQWTDGDAATAIREAASDKRFTVGYAPFREGDIEDITNSKKSFDREEFKQWRNEGTEIANMMGLKIEDDSNSIGVYAATSSNAEASRVIEVNGSDEDVEGYAAIMGVLAPDVQHSVMVNRYDENGSEKEHYITFKSKGDAVDFVNNRKTFGIEDVSLFPDKNKVLVLNFGNFDLNKTLETYGTRIKEHEERNIAAKFIGESDYPGIIRKIRDKAQQHNEGASWQKFNNILAKAEKRLKQ